MESYRNLEPAGLRGLVFDIDDTVTRNGVLEASAYTAMHQLSSAGFELIAVTGRPLGWADLIARQWPVRLAIGENGAGWSWVDGDRFEEGYFCNEQEREQQATVLERIREAVARTMPHVQVSSDDRARRCDLAFDVGELASLPRTDIDALVSLMEGFGVSTSVSTVHAHAAPGPWNKASGVARALSDTLGVDLDQELDRWVFVGDSGNDAEAFEYFSKSVGVANVRAHLDWLPVPPRFITDADRGEGFAELARHMMDGRG